MAATDSQNISQIEDDHDDRPPKPKAGRMSRSMAREIKREAKYYAQLIPDILASVGFDHWLRKESRPTGFERFFFGEQSRQKVKILHVAYNEVAIYLRIDPLRLPYRVRIPDFRDEEILETLSVACGRKVTFQLRDYSMGSWLVVAREGALGAIPKLFRFKDAINNIPATATPLRYCAGVTENMKLVTPDIEKMPHLLIAGATSMGKSVHLHAIMGQILWRNSPKDVQFILVDLKGGMELQDYRDIPHLWEKQKSIVTNIEQVVDVLRAYKDEMYRRQEIFAGKARSLPEWNRYGREKLPYLILVIDELAQVLRHPQRELSSQAMLELGSILSISRATGGHCILCTQRPSVDVVSGYLKTNIDGRVAFGVPTDADSRVILDTSVAADIELPGRAWMLYRAKRVQIQCPWISPTMIRRLVAHVIQREQGEQKPDIDILTVARLSLEHFEGNLSFRPIFDELRGKIARDDLLSMLQSFDNEVIDIDGKPYRIVAANGGTTSRHLQLLELSSDSASW